MEGFESFLSDLRRGRAVPVPADLLVDDGTARVIEADASVEARPFSSRLEAAVYLEAQLRPVDPAIRSQDRGLWSWLSLFYFDQLCPSNPTGKRNPGQSYRYVPSTDYRSYYRHLVLGPYQILTTCRPHGLAMLCGAFGSHGDMTEQIASRQELLVNAALVELIDRLYYDTPLEQLKRGATNRKRSGTLRRLIAFVDQLDLTYDLYSLSADQLEAMLPGEFDRWRRP